MRIHLSIILKSLCKISLPKLKKMIAMNKIIAEWTPVFPSQKIAEKSLITREIKYLWARDNIPTEITPSNILTIHMNH